MSDSVEAPPGGELMAEGLAHTARGLAQLATAALAAAQMGVRVHHQREEAGRSDDQVRADAARSELRARYAADRAAWAPGLEPHFATHASAERAMAVWGAAQPWLDHDRSAAQASAAAEHRLGLLHPDVIVQYQQFRDDGVGAHDAMAGAIEAARTLAEDQRGQAQRDLGAVDLASTPQIDERSEGAERGAAHQELSDASTAQAQSLVGQAYPRSIHHALQTKAGPSPAPTLRQAPPARPSRSR